jgi:hypothetical protein
MTPFGRHDIVSIGPLPEQYRVERARRQKERKAEGDRRRRRCQKFGLRRGDAFLLADVRLALGKLLFKEFQTWVGGPWLNRLQCAGHEFAGSVVSDEALAAHVRAARARDNDAAVAADDVARAVLAQVRDTFKPHAVRVSRGYDGPLRPAA